VLFGSCATCAYTARNKVTGKTISVGSIVVRKGISSPCARCKERGRGPVSSVSGGIEAHRAINLIFAGCLKEVKVATGESFSLRGASYRYRISVNVANVNIYGRIFEAPFDLATIGVEIRSNRHPSRPFIRVNILCTGRIGELCGLRVAIWRW
jgi:hypothetical protein